MLFSGRKRSPSNHIANFNRARFEADSQKLTRYQYFGITIYFLPIRRDCTGIYGGARRRCEDTLSRNNNEQECVSVTNDRKRFTVVLSSSRAI